MHWKIYLPNLKHWLFRKKNNQKWGERNKEGCYIHNLFYCPQTNILAIYFVIRLIIFNKVYGSFRRLSLNNFFLADLGNYFAFNLQVSLLSSLNCSFCHRLALQFCLFWLPNIPWTFLLVTAVPTVFSYQRLLWYQLSNWDARSRNAVVHKTFRSSQQWDSFLSDWSLSFSDNVENVSTKDNDNNSSDNDNNDEQNLVSCGVIIMMMVIIIVTVFINDADVKSEVLEVWVCSNV